MNYQETINFLFQALPAYHRVGAAAYKVGLDNAEAMMRHLGNPERGFRSIHVAGTNGKGSVSHFLASILQHAGLKVGLYTSPHLVDFRERIRINGRMIPEDLVVRFVDTHHSFLVRQKLSFFEMTMGLAFDYFRNERVDIAVIEVGMGGRLDSTNVITPLLEIITNIGFDHTQFLGNTLEKIAAEKAGIMKQGVPVVIGQTQPETASLFNAKAREQQAPIFFADQHYRVVEKEDDGLDMYADIYRDNSLYISALHSPMDGIYQRKNIATVCAAFDKLKELYFPQLTLQHFMLGIENVIRTTGLHGRWERVGENPLTIAETAHNADGVAALVEKLKLMHYRSLHIIYGCVNDKDFPSILAMMPADAAYYYTQPSVERGLDVNILSEKAASLGKPGPAFPDIISTLDHVRSTAHHDDLVIVTGSIFLIADLFAHTS